MLLNNIINITKIDTTTEISIPKNMATSFQPVNIKINPTPYLTNLNISFNFSNM